MVKVETTSKGRFYGENKLPSVTTILRVLDKPGLNNWRARVGHEEADRVSSEALDIGSETHRMCEEYALKSGVPFSMDPTAITLFYQYQRWFDASVMEVLHVEHQMMCDTYAGMADLICILKNGETAIVDIKTSKQCDPTMGDQLSALQKLYEDDDGRIDKLLVVRLKKKPAELANPKVKVQVKEYPYDMTVFNACLTIWEKRNGGKDE